MLRSIENDETPLRDLGLFSKILLDVEQTYVSIDSIYRWNEMLDYIRNIAANSYELESIDYISSDNAVNISTIHKVKGLEFPVVFVADLVNQRFPGRHGNRAIGLLVSDLSSVPVNSSELNDLLRRKTLGFALFTSPYAADDITFAMEQYEEAGMFA